MSISTEMKEEINAAFSEGGLYLNQYINFRKHQPISAGLKYMRILVFMKMLNEAKELVEKKLLQKSELKAEDLKKLQTFVTENIQMKTVTKEFDSIESFEKEFSKIGGKNDD